MSFTELTFIFIILPLSILFAMVAKWIHKARVRIVLALVLSLGIFAYYGWSEIFDFIIFIFLVYLSGQLVHATRGSGAGKKWTGLSVSLLTILLFYCKYVSAILNWWNDFQIFEIRYFQLISFTGISFIVFSAISYVVDIWRGDAAPGMFMDTALYLSFFPKLISGPIVLWKDFQKETVKDTWPVEKVNKGLDRIIIGYAKKLIIADTLGANIAYIRSMTGDGMDAPTYWIIAILYFFQIYMDFSGYSDIAIGLMNIFGFDVKENFRYPYISRSLTEFWRRWHISLGTWFREYVYIPLGGNRRGNVYFNLSVVFLLTGIWHGANFTFIIWGVAHGIVIVAERAVKDKTWYKKIPSVLKWVGTMLFVFFGWIMFMSPDVNSAFAFYRSLFSKTDTILNFSWRFFATRRTITILTIAALGSLSGLFFLKEDRKEKLQKVLDRPYILWARYIVLLAIFALDILFLVNSSYSPFIYMQF